MSDERDPQLVYAEKIAKLLRKAENTDSPQEAELLTDKAQQLMVQFAITEALLAQAAGLQVQDEIVKETITYAGIYHRTLFDIGAAIAKANGCKHLINSWENNRTGLVVIGFSKDVHNVKMLDQSLQVQASTAMQRWFRAQDTSYMSKMDKFKQRRQFFASFAHGLSAKLARAAQAGTQDAVTDEAQRLGVDVDVAQKSTDLVLLTKKERIDDWMDKTYGKSLRTVRRNYSHGGYAASSAGYSAGVNADIGQPRVGGKREIGQ